MKIARLLAPLMVAVALAAPATVPAAHAADTLMQYNGNIQVVSEQLAPNFSPKQAVLKQTERLMIHNATSDALKFTVTRLKAGAQTVQGETKTIGAGATVAFTFWQGQPSQYGPHLVYVENAPLPGALVTITP